MQDFRGLLATRNEAAQTSFFIRTYGCQMNERDSEKMAGLLMQMGFVTANTQEEADVIIYNTCCVRESAETKVIGHLSRLKQQKSERGFILAVGGCMPQQQEMAQLLQAKHKYIDIIFGTGNRHRLPEFIWRAINGERVMDITDGDTDLPEIADAPVTTREFPHKAGVNIMYGCNNFCSFCIVPHVRGREKSRPFADVLDEIHQLVADGVVEIMLLGQNVNSYDGGLTFAELLRRANEVPNLRRIRFMTSHPKDFSDELIAAVRDCEKVCNHVHLPLQAGNTRILEDMNRKYTKDDYLALVARLQAAIPEVAITTDIIVAYPGETDEDFEDTLDVVRHVGFAGAFTFIYSKRSGTPAAQRTDLVPRKTANERFDRLTAELYPLMEQFNAKKIGKVFDVMVESVLEKEEKPVESVEEKTMESTIPFTYKGRTSDHTLVHFSSAEKYLPGEILPVKINTAKAFYVVGSC